MGINPQPVHPVLINPDVEVAVTGPGIKGASVKSLEIGNGIGFSVLELDSGGQLEILGDLTIGTNGRLDIERGSIHVRGNTELSGQLGVQGQAIFDGNVSGHSGITGDGLIRFNRGYSPGASSGVIDIRTDVIFGGSSTLHIEVSGTTTSTIPIPGPDFDQVNIRGDVTLDGLLSIDLLGTDTPQIGTQYQVLTFASRAGTQFDLIDGAIINSQIGFAPIFTDSDLTLRTTVPGDVNFDNRVSIADLSVFALNFGSHTGIGSWNSGDFNADGQVSVADLSLLALNFGFDLDAGIEADGLSIEAAAALAGIDLSYVPEPTSFLILGMLGWVNTHRRLRPS